MSKDLLTMSIEVTMTIREIAKVLDSAPKDVLKSAKRLESKGVITIIAGDTVLSFDNQRLNKHDSITLVAQNKPEVTKAIVVKLDEMENRELSPIEALERQLEFMKKAESKLVNHEDRIASLEVYMPKKTNKDIRKKYNTNNCGAGYDHISSYTKQLVDMDMPISSSALTAFKDFYKGELRTTDNCIHTNDFAAVVQRIFDNAVRKGAFMEDEQSGIKFKADWLQ